MAPIYPPGVLQTVTIPDPTSLDGFGVLEITLIPSRGVTDINHFSKEGIQHFKEMLYEIDEEYRRRCDLKMEAIEVHLERFDRLANEVWDFNSGVVKRPDLWSWVNQEGPYDCSDCGWISYTDFPHFRDEYVAFVLHDIAEVLAMAEEDADYEEWLNSPQYVKSLEEYNRHKLLACDCSNYLWVGKYTDEKTFAVGNSFIRASYLMDRYKVNCIVRNSFPNQWGNTGYAVASSDYGDIYIPNKFCGYIGEPGSQVTMTVALQDVGGGGRKANGFRWTCIYIQ